MAKFTPVPGLDALVAHMVAPDVRDIAERVGNEGRRLAPPTKKWIAVNDSKTRSSHRGAHGQEVPANARFHVRSQPWDEQHGLSGGVDFLLYPRDTSTGLPLDSVQHIHCRCMVVMNPAGIAEKIVVGPTHIDGALVWIAVYCVAYKIVEAEFGDTYPGRQGMLPAEGSRFMSTAASNIARQGV